MSSSSPKRTVNQQSSPTPLVARNACVVLSVFRGSLLPAINAFWPLAKRDGYFQRGASAVFEPITPRNARQQDKRTHRIASAAPSTMAELAATSRAHSIDRRGLPHRLGSGKVAVLFGAEWDPPSQQLTQLLTEAATKKTYGGVKLATADADQCEAPGGRLRRPRPYRHYS